MATVVTQLVVPPLNQLPCMKARGVFDAWSWCASDRLEWRRPDSGERTAPPLFGASDADVATDATTIGADNPPGLVFVMHEPSAKAHFLPRELARLHAFGYGLEEEQALAPWAIDDATDLLYERRMPPRDVFWLAASSLEALVWGLHDWAHFHNHGPFDQPAMTELQCDLVALHWLRLNRSAIGIGPSRLDAVARDLAALSRRRFAEEGVCAPYDDFDALFAAPYPGLTS